MSDGYFDNNDRITYPQADRIVDAYITEMAAQKTRATSRDVLEWSDAPDIASNQKRVHDALSRVCDRTGDHWSGRTVFRLPNE